MNNNKVVSGKIAPVFFSFAIPVVIGMVASSSAGIIDGMFIGNFIGEQALAAVTLCVPIFPALLGISILFSTGGEVFAGKFIGEGNYKRASEVFTKVTLSIFFVSVLLSTLGLIFINPIARTMGAGEDTHQMATDYLRIVIGCTPFLNTFSLTFFVRVDGKPNLSSASMIITAILNVILDYVFIVLLDMGIKGAAWGTVLSYSAIPIMLLPHFLSQQCHINFVRPTKSLKILLQIAYNGSSEFFSEISGGILMFVINITIMKHFGTLGVAAYAVVGYLLYFNSMTCYGISDSIKSIISINYGAKEFERIAKFLRTAIVTVISFGLILVILTQVNSNSFVQLFFNENANTETGKLANDFVLTISPVLLILGVNIILSAYFTATHKPKPSLIISLARTLILPIILIPVLTYYMGGNGVITALITSEIITLAIAVILIIDNKKKA